MTKSRRLSGVLLTAAALAPAPQAFGQAFEVASVRKAQSAPMGSLAAILTRKGLTVFPPVLTGRYLRDRAAGFPGVVHLPLRQMEFSFS